MLGLIAFILEIFSDFALNIQEFFFRRKREKRRAFEREQNLPKQRMISPYNRVTILFFIIILTGIILSVLFNRTTLITKKDENLIEIKKLLENEKTAFGHYPKELKTIIRNNPLRSHLTEDPYGRNYQYIQLNEGESYLLFSLGKDGKPNTEDDIK